MLKIAICDDEKYYRDEIKKAINGILEERGLRYELDVFVSGISFLERADNAVRYDIVFMDINMEGIDGIETAMEIRKFHAQMYIVFVTAYIDYVLEGYKVNAVRYIMKDLLKASVRECMCAILEKMELQSVNFSFLEGEKSLYTDNILYVESRRHKVLFYYMQSDIATYQIYDKLDHIQEQLESKGFLRIHKSYLVNMKHIDKIANYEVKLDTGKILSVPRRRFRDAKEAFVAYKGAL